MDFCMTRNVFNTKHLLLFVEMGKLPSLPSYRLGDMLTTSIVSLYADLQSRRLTAISRNTNQAIGVPWLFKL